MILKLGNRSDYVKELQEALGIWVDGDFGPKTEKAVKQFQKENELTVDGIVGPATWKALKESQESTPFNTCSVIITANSIIVNIILIFFMVNF